MNSAEYIASAPAQWKRSASRQDAPGVTLQGLFADKSNQIAVDYISAADISHVFECDGAAASTFGLAIRDRLLIDGVQYSVDDLIRSDLGTVIATLRKAAI